MNEINKLKDKLNVNVIGSFNYPKDRPSIIVSNHNRLTDIFYVPMAIDDNIVSLISSRLVYKKELERQEMINKYLNPFPLEAHAGKEYVDICISNASKILQNGVSLNMFPEGAYIDNTSTVFRGRTDMARIIMDVLSHNKFVYILPVSIDTISDEDLDSYNLNPNNKVTIKILKPIDPLLYYCEYLKSYTKEEKNEILHLLTDRAMIEIANSLNRNYSMDYIELYPRKNIIIPNGDVIDINEIGEEKYIKGFEKDVKRLVYKYENIKNKWY